MRNNLFYEIAIEVERERFQRSKVLLKETFDLISFQRKSGVPYKDREILTSKVEYLKSIKEIKENKVELLNFEIWDGIDEEIKRIGLKRFVWIYRGLIYKPL